MKRDHTRREGKAALELIEEAIHLLRSASSAQLAIYYVGTLPFVLALLYFWGDMSRSPFAGEHLVEAALSLACLFIWMKTCHAIFAGHVRSLISGETPVFGASRVWRIVLAQAAIQPTGLFVLPLALLPFVPFPWAFAFYQNLSSLDDGQTSRIRQLILKASSQAMLWPKQNHLVLAILAAFGFFIFLNLITACFVLPALLKMLFGIETVFTRSGLSVLNTTFLAATLALTYLCVDPIIKSIYALRCFYGESQRSGEDLKVELRRSTIAPVGLVLVALLVLAFGSTNLVAAEPNAEAAAIPASPHPGSPVASLPATELDTAIQEVVQQPKFAWREPRKKMVATDDSNPGFLRRLFKRITPFLKNSLKTVARWIDALLRRLQSRQRNPGSGDAAARWVMFLHLMVYGLIAATALGLGWMFYRIWKKRGQPLATISSEPLQPVPDLSDENLGADQMPEDSWVTLARKLLANGELRLALRAYYLASLAQLASKNLIQLARFKSNRDYQRELQRRAHSFPGLLSAFGDNLSVFERIWYGLHEIDNDVVHQFADNVERMRTVGSNTAASAQPL